MFQIIPDVTFNSLKYSVVVVQSLSHVRHFVTSWTTVHQGSLSFTISWSLLKLMSIELVMASNHLVLCHPLLLLPSLFPSIRVFLMSWLFTLGGQVLEPQHQSFQWIFRIDFLYDWLVWSPCSPKDSQDSFPPSHFKSINSSVLSFLYDPTLTSIYDYWKTHSFEYMHLYQQRNISVFNMLSRFVITFLPRSKHLLISWLQSPSAVILEPKKIKSVTVFIFSPIYLPRSDGTGCHDLTVLNAKFKASFFTHLFHPH